MTASKLNQRGIERRDLVAEHLHQTRAHSVRAHRRRGASAHGGDDVRRKKPRTIRKLHRPAAAAGWGERDDLRIRQHRDGVAFTGHAQHVEHGGGGHRAGIDAAVLHGGHQAERGEEGGDLLRRHGGIDPLDERRGLAVMRRLHIQIGQVAAAVSRGQQLFTHARQALDHCNAQPPAAKRGRGAQAARAAAQNHAIGLHGNILQSFNSIYYTIDKGKNTMRGLMSGANRDRLKKRRRAAHTSA